METEITNIENINKQIRALRIELDRLSYCSYNLNHSTSGWNVTVKYENERRKKVDTFSTLELANAKCDELCDERDAQMKKLRAEIQNLVTMAENEENEQFQAAFPSVKRFFIDRFEDMARNAKNRAESSLYDLNANFTSNAEWCFEKAFKYKYQAEFYESICDKLKTTAIEKVIQQYKNFLMRPYNVRSNSTNAITNEIATWKYQITLEIYEQLESWYADMLKTLEIEKAA